MGKNLIARPGNMCFEVVHFMSARGFDEAQEQTPCQSEQGNKFPVCNGI
jgi:hypothetical protein